MSFKREQITGAVLSSTQLKNSKICSWGLGNNMSLVFPLYSQKIFIDLQAEGFPVIETSTLTEEGVIKVKTEVSALLSFSCLSKVSRGERVFFPGECLWWLRQKASVQAPSLKPWPRPPNESGALEMLSLPATGALTLSTACCFSQPADISMGAGLKSTSMEPVQK